MICNWDRIGYGGQIVIFLATDSLRSSDKPRTWEEVRRDCRPSGDRLNLGSDDMVLPRSNHEETWLYF